MCALEKQRFECYEKKRVNDFCDNTINDLCLQLQASVGGKMQRSDQRVTYGSHLNTHQAPLCFEKPAVSVQETSQYGNTI